MPPRPTSPRTSYSPTRCGSAAPSARPPSARNDTPPPAHRPPPGTSLTLLQRLRDDEPEAWRTVVRLYTPLLCHWCARRGVRGADAEDVIQEVLRAAAAGLAGF